MLPGRERANLAHMFRDLGGEPAEEELSTNTQFPHLNTKEYLRRMKNPEDSTTAQEFHESFDINLAGKTVVAINDYRTRFWVGHFWGYETTEDYKQRGNNPREHKPITTSPINVIRFIQDNLIALGRVTGTVEVWSTNTSVEGYFPIDQKNEHIGSVLDIDVFMKHEGENKNSLIVSVDSEACIKIWEVDYMDVVSTSTFRHAHGGAITGVSTRPGSDDVFVTASRDKSSCLWDLRLASRPASGLLQKHKNALTAVCWSLGDSGEQEESCVVKLGDAAGSILTVDVRKANEVVQEVSAFERPVKRIRATKGKFAVCGHTNSFKVFNNDDQLILEDASSQDFVRDITFQGDKVLSLCWDGNIVEKDI